MLLTFESLRSRRTHCATHTITRHYALLRIALHYALLRSVSFAGNPCSVPCGCKVHFQAHTYPTQVVVSLNQYEIVTPFPSRQILTYRYQA